MTGLAGASDLQPTEAARRLQGTFIQLSDHHSRWSGAQWSELFDSFRRLGLSEVIVQWTAFDKTRFYSSGANSGSPLDMILSEAARSEMRVWIGLYHDPEYWNRIERDPVERVLYLRRLRSRALETARDLAPALRSNPHFMGWYVSEEIDDVNWNNPEAYRALLEHLRRISTGLKSLTPSAKVAISTFSNARLSPTRFRFFWQTILEAAHFDVILLQDGIGANKLELREFPLFADALAAAAAQTGREFAVIVELFRQTGGTPLDNGPFKAEAAPWERVHEQLGLANQFTGSTYGFSVPEYMSRTGTQGALELFDRYLENAAGKSRFPRR